jgi:S-adenosylmethionine hydrolase
LAHEIPPQDVSRGAAVLSQAARHGPTDGVYVAIVDPGVGTERRPVVIEAGEGFLVGPDNGVLSSAWAELGGIRRAFTISSPDVMLDNVSPTFHGRDVFSPCAAHLSRGLSVDEVGEEIDPKSLVEVSFPGARIEPGYVHCKVIGVDRFGNVQLSARPADLAEAGIPSGEEIHVRAGGNGYDVPMRATFSQVEEGDGVVVVDSSGFLTLAKNRRHAAEELGIHVGEHVVLCPRVPAR